MAVNPATKKMPKTQTDNNPYFSSNSVATNSKNSLTIADTILIYINFSRCASFIPKADIGFTA